MPPVSKYWKHFTKISDKSAKCNHCGKVLKTSGNTSNIKCHLESLHSGLIGEKGPQAKKKKTRASSPTVSEEVFSQSPLEGTDDETTRSLQSPSPSTSSAGPSKSSVPTFAQQTLPAIFKEIGSFKEGGDSSRKVTQAIVYMICSDLLPIRMVEKRGFLKLMKTVARHYTVPSRFTFKRLISQKYTAMKDVMKNKLENKKCTLTTDAWTDLQMRSFLSITVHFHQGDGKMFNGNLGMIPLEGSHTGDYLSSEIEKMCREWQINIDDVTAVVTDNGANIVKAVTTTFGAKKHIPCFAHTLNLVAVRCLDSCEDAKTLVEKVKAIVTWFKHSTVASDELRKKCEKKLIQSVPTRWNSTFHMLERFLELRPHVNEIINKHRSAPAMVTAAEIEELSEFCEVLMPLNSATNEISGENYLTSSLAIPIAHITQEKIEQLSPTKLSAIKLQREILNDFKKRFGCIERCHLLGLATILDPRFKTLYFKDAITQAKHLRYIDSLVKANEKTATSSSPSSESDTQEAKAIHSLFSEHNKVIQKKWRKSEPADTPLEAYHAELSLYIRAPAEKIQQNPMLFWSQMSSSYPLLSGIATNYLSTVATSVPSERLFSKAGQILSKSRNRLEGKFASKLLFLNSIPEDMWTF